MRYATIFLNPVTVTAKGYQRAMELWATDDPSLKATIETWPHQLETEIVRLAWEELARVAFQRILKHHGHLGPVLLSMDLPQYSIYISYTAEA
jgi:hypothetical protein